MDLSSLSAVSSTASAASQVADFAAMRAWDNRPFSGAAMRNAPAAVQRHEVAEQFEAIIVRQLLGPTLTKMLGDSKDTSSSIFGDLLTNSFAQQLARGGGLGLAHTIEQQITPRAAAHAPAAAGAAPAPAAQPPSPAIP